MIYDEEARAMLLPSALERKGIPSHLYTLLVGPDERCPLPSQSKDKAVFGNGMYSRTVYMQRAGVVRAASVVLEVSTTRVSVAPSGPVPTQDSRFQLLRWLAVRADTHRCVRCCIRPHSPRDKLS